VKSVTAEGIELLSLSGKVRYLTTELFASAYLHKNLRIWTARHIKMNIIQRSK